MLLPISSTSLGALHSKGGAIFVPDGRLVSCRSCLLNALLPFGHSWSLLSALVPYCSSL